ncbi:MAG TPA: hypothetical protein PLA27_10010 [Anaerolineales bacterium]|jgi:hypothetical protein|nr:hypothetical protein [Anaerolineales bacterium]HQX16743.1 hypothetical protein [Anaerolineales bacterium]
MNRFVEVIGSYEVANALGVNYDVLASQFDKTVICQIRDDPIEVCDDQRFEFLVTDIPR